MTGKRRGFTLVEVMIAASIMALGAVLIYESFFMCIDSFNNCADRLDIAPWIDEKIWQAQDEIMRAGTLDEFDKTGGFVMDNNQYNWRLYSQILSASLFYDLYKVNLNVSWKEGKRYAKSSRTAYAIYNKEE